MNVLGIESSCDETAAAVLKNGIILSNIVATQHDVHARFGGVVPELASRRHLENIVPVIKCALSDAHIKLSDLDGIAVTYAPGLLGSLLVGISAAKGIAYVHDVKLIGVNHLEGHLNAASLEFGPLPLPYVGLVVSGGHTSLYLVKKFGDYKLIGATRDDAAGEAFDKAAKLLGLGYPGGPAIDAASKKGNPRAFKFTRPKFSSDACLDFSFSGIKTALLHLYKKNAAHLNEGLILDMAASFQGAVVEILVDRVKTAAEKFGAKAVVLAGGVAANSKLRRLMKQTADTAGMPCFIPSMNLCTDNAAMIAYVGAKHLAEGKSSGLNLNAIANEEIG